MDQQTKIIKHILVGVDDSPDALTAFQYALHRAKQSAILSGFRSPY